MARQRSLKRMLARRKAIKKRLDKNDDYAALRLLDYEISNILKPYRNAAKALYLMDGTKSSKDEKGKEVPIEIRDMLYTYEIKERSATQATILTPFEV